MFVSQPWSLNCRCVSSLWCSEADEAPDAPEPPEPGGKRKRRREGEGAGKVPKRRRSARGGQEPVVIEDDPPAEGPAGRGRLSRARGAGAAEQTPVQKGSVVVLEDTPPPARTEKGDAAPASLYLCWAQWLSCMSIMRVIALVSSENICCSVNLIIEWLY